MTAATGGTVLNLTGEWELDKENSQTIYNHMRLLGCDEIAALASEKVWIDFGFFGILFWFLL